MAKKTQVQLLQEIADLLLPMSNLARFQISKINEQIKKDEEFQAGTTAEAEMKKKSQA